MFHNGKIEWNKVDSDILFAYMKASEGGNFVDKGYVQNRDGAQRNGIKVGGYHFFRENVPGDVQYSNFISHVGETELIPAVDIEDVTFSEEMAPNLKELCRLLEEHYGVKPIIYADLEVYMRCYSYLKDHTSKNIHSLQYLSVWQNVFSTRPYRRLSPQRGS